jgi:EpsI family protein
VQGLFGGILIRRVIIVSALMLAVAIYFAVASTSESTPIRRSLSELPVQIGMWEEKGSNEFDSSTLEVLGVDDYINRLYGGPNSTEVGLYVGYYMSQRQGDTIHSPLNCLPGSGWNAVQKDVLTVPIQAPPAALKSGQDRPLSGIKINRIVIQKGLDKQVVLYWYQSHGRVIASEYWGKIYTVIDAIRINRTDAALVRVISPVRGTEEAAEYEAEKAGVDFVKQLFTMLDQYLPI